MSQGGPPFAEEWRKCLREHYKHVVRADDRKTLESLEAVLNRVGFREDELQVLYREATMRTDELHEGFAPDLQRAGGDDRTWQTHPAECSCAACMDGVLEEGHDEEGQPITDPDELAEIEARKKRDENVPKQLSLF